MLFGCCSQDPPAKDSRGPAHGNLSREGLVSNTRKAIFSFSIMFLLLLAVGFGQSWNVMLAIFNLCLISAVMSLGLNIQWGYAGIAPLDIKPQ